MIKEIYLISSKNPESYDDFKKRITELALKVEKEYQAEFIKFTITEKSPPALSIIPFKKSKIAAISLWRNGEKEIDELIRAEDFYGAYKVKEALPVSYKKDWKDLEPTPGVCLLTLFNPRNKIDYESFIDRWHNSHTPLSLKIHPLWNYVRNVVENPLTDQSKPFKGIVEEHFRTASDLLNPFRFFGNPLIIIYRMMQVYIDTKAFIDYPSMETYLTTEYHIKS